MDREAWRATVHSVVKSQARLSTHTFYQYYIETDNIIQSTAMLPTQKAKSILEIKIFLNEV